MEEIRGKKGEIINNISKIFSKLSANNISEKTKRIEKRLFEFANFIEAKTSLLYINSGYEVVTKDILKRCFDYNKTVVLPSFNVGMQKIYLLKVDNLKTGLKRGENGILEPDTSKCKIVPIQFIDIAIIPGFAFDEKGGRIGSGDGFYDRLIPMLPVTTRKVGLAYESQIIQQVPMESHDKHVDIIITENRIIYKI
ncbi:MAG: 5-formyltetrahydrofolate cyclo-ligase [Proteobacteria bacterium]|nr:5-formyltetrahydrofolate cyclo-ligase [Pseudomonadota bacterium]MBU1570365.1 5-formyltetrahydrofolate cyclo-ligase [Pseudomonadota bacterium]